MRSSTPRLAGDFAPRRRLGPAADALRSLPEEPTYDFAFVDADKQGPDVEAIRRFNELVVADPRVDSVMLPVADGLTLARKRP